MYKPKDFKQLVGISGLSDGLLENHFALYEGYVKNVNHLIDHLNMEDDEVRFSELKRRFGWEFGGMRLHELYFENLSKEVKNHDESSSFHEKIVQEFGSHEAWEKDLKRICAMRGIGWAIMYYDRRSDQIFNAWVNEHDLGHLAGCEPILVLDLFEHAYILDYGIQKMDYVNAIFSQINWPEVEARFALAKKGV